MQTCSFFRVLHRQHQFGERLVSIAFQSPGAYRGRSYPALAPRREMLKMDEATYRVAYQKILDHLDPRQVCDNLGEDAILLCWVRRESRISDCFASYIRH